MTDIKDYLHLYLGCDCLCVRGSGQNNPLQTYKEKIEGWHVDDFKNFKSIKPLLRPLSDMTEEDVIEWSDVMVKHTPYCVELDSKNEFGEFTEVYPDGSILSKSKDDGDIRPINGGKLFLLLLARGFDLFGLIESGLAIDKSKLKVA